eukprot:72312-Karenia_brevis.AAC.1
MGWDHSFFRNLGGKADDHDFLCTLAGRAFSAFAFVPVAIATLAAIGLSGEASGASGVNDSEDLSSEES